MLLGFSLGSYIASAQSSAQLTVTFSAERASAMPGFNEFDILFSAGPGYVTDNAIYAPNTTNPDGSWVSINLRFTQSGAGTPLINTEFVVTYPVGGISGGQVTNVPASGCYPTEPAFNISIARSSPGPDASGTPLVVATVRYPNTHGPKTLAIRNTTTQACASRESFWSNAHSSNTTTRIPISGNSVALPIELLSFEPRTDKCDLNLYWATATEKNFGYFEIEASKDGSHFASIAQQKPASPNSLEKRTYKYAVPQAYHGYYFRLKSVDLDAAYDYSKIVYTQAPCDKQYSAQLYPNPNVIENLTVEINSAENEDQIQLIVLDAVGKHLQTQQVDIQAGMNKITVDTQALPSGTYFIKIVGITKLSAPLKFIKSTF